MPFRRTLFRENWVVYAKRPFGGPEHVSHYLARYTHRVAISNYRLLNVTDQEVTFRWKDYTHHSKPRTMTLTHEEFLRRFLQHIAGGFPAASATLAFSPIVAAAYFCRFAESCWTCSLPSSRPLLQLYRAIPVPAVKLSCALWNASLRANFSERRTG